MMTFKRWLLLIGLLGSGFIGGLGLINAPAGTPTTTASTLPNSVELIWAGAVTSSTVTVNAKVITDTTSVRLHISEQPDLSDPILSPFFTADTATNNRVVSIPITGLQSNTPYHYAIEADGIVDTANQGQFQTFPAGAASFTFAVSGDATVGSNHIVFDTIRQQNPLFFLHSGDLHYEDIGVNDVELFRAAYETVLTTPRQAELYRSTAIAYMWDDHDYGPNNSDRTAPGREASRLTYQLYTPHYPLPAGAGDVPIYQAFTVGRVRFILTDTRSERSPNGNPDDASKTMLGTTQKAWLKNELLSANGNYRLIIWLNSVPWINSPTAGSDTWGGFTTERTELANFIKDNNILGLFMLSGDAHMLAIDDGSNSGYATGGGGAFPLMHAASLDRPGSTKGGPYSHGTFPGRGQFGLITITDIGLETVDVTLSGRDEDNNELVSHTFTSPDFIPTSINMLPIVIEQKSIGWLIVLLAIVTGLFVMTRRYANT